MFPIYISSIGICVCLVMHFVATDVMPVRKEADIETVLKIQLFGTAVIMTGVMYPVADGFLPDKMYISVLLPSLPSFPLLFPVPPSVVPLLPPSFLRSPLSSSSFRCSPRITHFLSASSLSLHLLLPPSSFSPPRSTSPPRPHSNPPSLSLGLTHVVSVQGVEDAVTPANIYGCVLFGLWAGTIIGFITEFFTSHSYGPTREVARSCETGAATNIIYGPSLLRSLFHLACFLSFISRACLDRGVSRVHLLGRAVSCVRVEHGVVCLSHSDLLSQLNSTHSPPCCIRSGPRLPLLHHPRRPHRWRW